MNFDKEKQSFTQNLQESRSNLVKLRKAKSDTADCMTIGNSDGSVHCGFCLVDSENNEAIKHAEDCSGVFINRFLLDEFIALTEFTEKGCLAALAEIEGMK